MTDVERRGADIHGSSRLDDAVAFRLHRTNRLLLTHLSRFLGSRTRGVSPEKWFVLARLRESGPLHQVRLTDPALVDAPNISRLVDSLVRSGLVERHADPTDRRSRVLQLTAEGRELTDDLLAAVVEERRRVFDGFSDSELATLTTALDRLDGNVRALLTAPHTEVD